MPRIGVMGPIGAGKSTLSEHIAKHFHADLVPEDVQNNPYLPYFYEDKKTFAFLSQNAFYASLFLNMWKKKDSTNVVFDSTLYSNLVFTNLLIQEGYMTITQAALTYCIADQHKLHLPELDLYIVILRDKPALFRNVRNRGRDMEQGQIDYLHFHYDNYYKTLDKIFETYRIPEEKIFYLRVHDMMQPAELIGILDEIKKRVEK